MVLKPKVLSIGNKVSKINWKKVGLETARWGIPIAMVAAGLYYSPHFYEYEGIQDMLEIKLSAISTGIGASVTGLNVVDYTRNIFTTETEEYEF